jgi:CRP-like cAMP-binding protein
MEMGADDYITKPFSDSELINAIRARLEKIKILKAQGGKGIENWYQIISDLGNKDEMHDALESHDVIQYKKKQVIYSEGQHPNKLYYIQTGKVKIYKTSDGGKELIIGLLSAGDFFGHIPLIENSIYEEFAETMEESTIRVIPRKEFEHLITQNQEIALKVIKLLANNISEKEQQLVALAYHSLRKRVADALLTLKKKYASKEEEGNFSISISREDLANIAGTATESLIRTLSDFKSEKLIEIKEGKIIILEEKKLTNLFN